MHMTFAFRDHLAVFQTNGPFARIIRPNSLFRQFTVSKSADYTNKKQQTSDLDRKRPADSYHRH